MSFEQAMFDALARARAALAGVPFEGRCASLGLPCPNEGVVALRVFAEPHRFDCATLTLSAESGTAAHPAEQLLFLHYLACDVPVSQTGELVSFRQFPGGQFYHGPFQKRTGDYLAQVVAGRAGLLRAALDELGATAVGAGDVSGTVTAMGNASLGVVYYAPDDEFGARCEILFDRSVTRAFGADDASGLGGRLVARLVAALHRLSVPAPR